MLVVEWIFLAPMWEGKLPQRVRALRKPGPSDVSRGDAAFLLF